MRCGFEKSTVQKGRAPLTFVHAPLSRGLCNATRTPVMLAALHALYRKHWNGVFRFPKKDFGTVTTFRKKHKRRYQNSVPSDLPRYLPIAKRPPESLYSCTLAFVKSKYRIELPSPTPTAAYQPHFERPTAKTNTR